MSENARDPAVADPPPGPEAAKQQGMSQLIVDLGPIAIFVISYNVLQRTRPDDAIFIATGIFIAATLAAIAWCYFKRGKVPPVLILTGVLVTGFGGLSILLHNEEFMKIKPTFMYAFYVIAIVVSILIKQNVWKLLFQHVFTLPDRIWDILAWRWAGCFAVLGVVNEVIRLNYSTDFWVNSRLLIFFPAVMGFALLNAPLALKHMPKAEAEGGNPAPPSQN